MANDIFILRKATANDLDELLSLEKRAVVELNLGSYPQDLVEQAVREIEMINLPLLDEGHFFALTDDTGRIIACGGWSQEIPAYAKSLDIEHNEFVADVAVVRSMFVDPAMARRGLGSRIMSVIEDDARDHGIRLLTLSATKMGEPLYRACGFTPLSDDIYVLSDGREIRGLEMEKVIATEGTSCPVAGAAA